MLSLSNGVLSIQVDDKYLDESEGQLVERLLNTNYMIKVGKNLYTYDGLILSNVTLTDDGASNYIIDTGKIQITIPQSNVIETTYDEVKLKALCDLFSTVCTYGLNIETDTYAIDPTNETITLKPLANTYNIVGDIPKLIVDYVDYVKTTKSITDDATAQQHIIDTELANLAKLKDELEAKARSVFSLYIQLAQYKSTP
jgi:hypothetical protein